MNNENGPASFGSVAPGPVRLHERNLHVPVREAAPDPLPAAVQPRDPHDPQPALDSSGVSVERLQHEVQQDWYNELHLLAPTAFLLVGFDCTIFQINLSGADLLGIDRLQSRQHRFREFINPPYLSDWVNFLERSLNSQSPVRCMLDVRCRDQVMPVTLIGCADGSGQACRVMVERAEGRIAALEASEERFRRIVHTAQEGIWEIDANARTTFVNPKMAQLLGWTIEEMLQRPLLDFMDEDGRVLAQRDLARRRSGLAERLEFRFVRKDGQSVWTSIATNPIFDHRGDYMGAVALVTDVSDRRQGVELAWQRSNFDSLTGLPNRQMFMDRLAVESRRADRTDGFLALALVNLDHFREINNRLGPAMGDALLAQAGRRLASCVRSSDTLARTGGDEFAVVLAGLDHLGSVERIAQSLLAAMARPFEVQGRRQFMSASIGIALYPQDATSIDDMMRAAGAALDLSRQAGRSRFSYARADMQEAAQLRQTMAEELREALTQRQFEVWYQPVVNLFNNKIFKAEALLRWRHPTRGLLAPAEFLPYAEANGLLAEIGDWVFRQVAQQVQQWQRSIDPAFQVSVNKSPLQFRKDADAYQGWLAYLRQMGLPQNSIVVEITESALMGGAPQVSERLAHFRTMGVQVALDDFGKGYASLAHLQRFAVDYLKIDQSFVAQIEEDEGQLAMCEAIIAMAHKLGVKVVAEGVETRVQSALLRDAGCDYAQGYMFARPMPAGEFEPVALASLARLPH